MVLTRPVLPTAAQIEVRTIMDALRRIVQALRVSSRAAEMQLGITGAQLFVLQRLAEQPAQAIGDLADGTFTHQSSVSVVVKRLAERGLLVRQAAADDRRRLEISLTAKGRSLVRRAPQAAQVQIVAALQRLPALQRRALARSLDLVARHAGVGDAPPNLFFEDHPPPKRRKRRPAR
jgi:DNA-binding MarR family transcriptional regulator